jgi:DNA invertase Pin-like site-specific DNA recombinase
MIIGYARTSTTDQKAGLEAQLRDLKVAGCEKIFVEEVSSVDIANRGQLDGALEFVRLGDTLVVTKLDRLARSVAHLLSIVEIIESKGAALRTLDQAIDTGTPNGRLMLGILGSISQFEREIMLERQREGIAKAKAEGRYKGRKPTARAQSVEVKRLVKDEGMSAVEVAKRLGIGRSSVYRIVQEGDL